MDDDKEEEETLKVRETDILSEPFADSDGMIDLLIADNTGPDITDRTQEIQDAYDRTPPINPDEEVVQPPLPPPVINDADSVLSVSVKKGAALAKFVGNPIENDQLVETIRNESSTTTILNAIMEEMAEEAAFIKAWRNEQWNGEADLSEATGKRIKMLKDLVETLIEREKLKKEKNVGKIDFHGENFQKVLRYFLEVIQKTFKKVSIPTQFEDIFFTQLAKEFNNFEKTAEKIYYGKE
jgi:hypothetical protein